MRLEIEIDYEPSPREQKTIEEACDDQRELHRVVQGILRRPLMTVQGVDVYDD